MSAATSTHSAPSGRGRADGADTVLEGRAIDDEVQYARRGERPNVQFAVTVPSAPTLCGPVDPSGHSNVQA